MIENIKEVKALLAVPKNIVITSHRNPDGDAIGSSLGLYHLLIQMGHTVRVIFPSEFPPIFSWMPHSDLVIIYDLDQDRAKDLLKGADVIFALDFNALDRIDKMGEIIHNLKSKPKILMIDHHLFPEPFADYVLSETSASSTSELVWDFIKMIGEDQKLNPTIGSCLYTGIVTDTGSFKFSTSPKLFRTVAEMLERGVEDYKLQDLIFNCQEEKSLKLLGHCLNNRMEILPEYHTGIITLTKADYEEFEIQRGDTEGIVNYLLSLKIVKLACFITEQPTIVKLSLRSKGDFNVQEICRDHFRGGGHKNASGGYSYGGLKATVTKLKEILPKYKDKLLS
jgi:bifunctional oligoribonuclease and PAP phosphatase NrnA